MVLLAGPRLKAAPQLLRFMKALVVVVAVAREAEARAAI